MRFFIRVRGFIGPQTLLLIGGLLLASLVTQLAQVNIVGSNKPDLTIFVRQDDVNRSDNIVVKRFDIEITNLGAKTSQRFDISVDWADGKGVETINNKKVFD